MSRVVGETTPRRNSIWRWGLRLVAMLAGVLLVYTIAAFALGRVPVNADFRSAPSGIPVVVMDNGIHVDLLLPVTAAGHDWREVFDPAATNSGAGLGDAATHVLIGWGPRDFYLNTPTWSDMTVATAVKAVFGIGGTVMHVTFGSLRFEPGRDAFFLLSPTDYRRLVEGIVATAVRDEGGRAIPLDADGYTDFDAFYEASGRYNALHTCNNWAASILSDAGVRVPLWSPFSGAVMDQIRAGEPN